MAASWLGYNARKVTGLEFILETKDLTKIYGQKEAVRDVNLHIQEGTIYGLIGRTGAGRSEEHT